MAANNSSEEYPSEADRSESDQENQEQEHEEQEKPTPYKDATISREEAQAFAFQAVFGSSIQEKDRFHTAFCYDESRLRSCVVSKHTNLEYWNELNLDRLIPLLKEKTLIGASLL